MALTVVYDADCGVCQASVAWARKRDVRGALEFVPNDVPQLPPGVSLDETEHTIVVLDGGRKFTRGEGVARILRELPRWRPVAAAIRAPVLRHLSNWGYDQFARRRHRISAALGMGTCEIRGHNTDLPTGDPGTPGHPSGTSAPQNR